MPRSSGHRVAVPSMDSKPSTCERRKAGHSAVSHRLSPNPSLLYLCPGLPSPSKHQQRAGDLAGFCLEEMAMPRGWGRESGMRGSGCAGLSLAAQTDSKYGSYPPMRPVPVTWAIRMPMTIASWLSVPKAPLR